MHTEQQLAEIQARADAATYGQRVEYSALTGCRQIVGAGGYGIGQTEGIYNDAEDRANAELWAAARQDVPELVKTVRELMAENDAYKMALGRIVHKIKLAAFTSQALAHRGESRSISEADIVNAIIEYGGDPDELNEKYIEREVTNDS